MNRREFSKLAALGASAALLPASLFGLPSGNFVSQRPPRGRRNFESASVEALIEDVQKNIRDAELAWMFSNCFPNTLDTTVFFEMKDGKPDTYVITGDIDAMWLRDSSAQINPYLPLCPKDKHLSAMVEGLIRRQTHCILLDPYANAFYKDETKISPWHSDKTEMRPGVHERKWELDSLCYCLRLAYKYWKLTDNNAPFDDTWHQAMKLVLDTMKDQQRKEGKGNYHFQRLATRKSDTQTGEGYGAPFEPTGMICSAFRNSDDATTYLFNIPENLFAVTALRQLAEMIKAIGDPDRLTNVCDQLADEVEQATLKYGTWQHPKHGKIYLYECDGLGNSLAIEDAGIPGLVTIPYLGYGSTTDELYRNSRAFALSSDNPFFYHSSIAEGVGSLHLADKGQMIWPMSIVSRAITSSDDQEISHCLQMLKATHAGTGFMHEGFQKNKPTHFTRHWFAWANSYFGEMVWKLYQEKKNLL